MLDSFFDLFMEWSFKFIFAPLLILATLAAGGFLFIGLPYFIYHLVTDKPPEVFTLKVNEFQCIQSHNETVTTYVMIGKVMTPITSVHSVCDVYGRHQ